MTKVILNRIREHLVIKARRDGVNHITHEMIEQATGLSHQTVNSHINNKVKRYDVHVIKLWCEYLGITPDQFFTFEVLPASQDSSDDVIEGEMNSPLLATA